MEKSMQRSGDAVFRAYDIRGVVGVDFTASWMERLGRAFGTWLSERGLGRVVLGRDGRASSPEYQLAMARGLLATGRDVLLGGCMATPVLYHAVHSLGTRAGGMVTASHNPPEYNGCKLWGGDTVLSPEEIQEVRYIFERGVFAVGRGVLGSHDPIPSWLEEVAGLERIQPPANGAKPLHIVVDGGNGPAGTLTADLLERAGAEAGIRVERLFCDVDPAFPNHHPDPVVEENMRQLQERVKTVGADLGLGLDGDGDRLGVVDETGELWPGDRLLALFARDVLTRVPGARIIADVKCSQRLFDDIETHGGEAVMGVTGHSIMKRALREQGAALAGELSGHIFFGQGFFGWDDAAYAALRLTALVSRSSRPVSRMLEDWSPAESTPEIRIPCPDEHKFEVVRRVQKDLEKQHRIIDVDGVRVLHPGGWGLVRASNTQPELTLRFEAATRTQLEELRTVVCDAVNRAVRALQ